MRDLWMYIQTQHAASIAQLQSGSSEGKMRDFNPFSSKKESTKKKRKKKKKDKIDERFIIFHGLLCKSKTKSFEEHVPLQPPLYSPSTSNTRRPTDV